MPTDRVIGRSSLVKSFSIPTGQELPKNDSEREQHSIVQPQVIGVLGKDGKIVKVTFSNENLEKQIQMEDPISEVHLANEETEQPHLADECKSDIQMPSLKASDN